MTTMEDVQAKRASNDELRAAIRAEKSKRNTATSQADTDRKMVRAEVEEQRLKAQLTAMRSGEADEEVPELPDVDPESGPTDEELAEAAAAAAAAAEVPEDPVVDLSDSPVTPFNHSN